MIRRTLQQYLLRDARLYPVLTLTGPRQSGKTTLARATFPQHRYYSLEDPDQRIFALEDPRGFLDQLDGPVILDEAQRVPELFSYIQSRVDADGSTGRFVLTGSQNFLLMDRIVQTLAGRCAVLHLLPLSRAELEGQAQPVPETPAALFAGRKTQLQLWQTLYTGFYPRIHDQRIPPAIWLPDYVQTYLERDVRSLVNIGNMDAFERFLALCAGRVGQVLNCAALANDCGIAVDTAQRWISVLKTSFVVFLLPPHYRNFNKRLIKSPKLYFYDTGLACYLLGIKDPQVLPTHPLRGPLFENYQIAEAAKAFHHHRQKPPLYFWRDRTGHEVDLLVEQGSALYPIEIKSGQTISSDAFTALTWWSRTAGQDLANASLIYGGDRAYRRNKVAVQPWFAI